MAASFPQGLCIPSVSKIGISLRTEGKLWNMGAGIWKARLVHKMAMTKYHSLIVWKTRCLIPHLSEGWKSKMKLTEVWERFQRVPLPQHLLLYWQPSIYLWLIGASYWNLSSSLPDSVPTCICPNSPLLCGCQPRWSRVYLLTSSAALQATWKPV